MIVRKGAWSDSDAMFAPRHDGDQVHRDLTIGRHDTPIIQLQLDQLSHGPVVTSQDPSLGPFDGIRPLSKAKLGEPARSHFERLLKLIRTLRPKHDARPPAVDRGR